MHSTAQSLSLPDLSAEQHASLFADTPLLSVYKAFGAVPDPRSRHGQRYDLPYLLTCLVAALRMSTAIRWKPWASGVVTNSFSCVSSLDHAIFTRPPDRCIVACCLA